MPSPSSSSSSLSVVPKSPRSPCGPPGPISPAVPASAVPPSLSRPSRPSRPIGPVGLSDPSDFRHVSHPTAPPGFPGIPRSRRNPFFNGPACVLGTPPPPAGRRHACGGSDRSEEVGQLGMLGQLGGVKGSRKPDHGPATVRGVLLLSRPRCPSRPSRPMPVPLLLLVPPVRQSDPGPRRPIVEQCEGPSATLTQVITWAYRSPGFSTRKSGIRTLAGLLPATGLAVYRPARCRRALFPA
jgi:hypothetical protein